MAGKRVGVRREVDSPRGEGQARCFQSSDSSQACVCVVGKGEKANVD